jgi:hypothetical protein
MIDFKYHEVKQLCWDRNIFIIQKPIHQGGSVGKEVKLCIDFDGNKKWGTEFYTQNSIKLEKKIEYLYRYVFENYILD